MAGVCTVDCNLDESLVLLVLSADAFAGSIHSVLLHALHEAMTRGGKGEKGDRTEREETGEREGKYEGGKGRGRDEGRGKGLGARVCLAGRSVPGRVEG